MSKPKTLTNEKIVSLLLSQTPVQFVFLLDFVTRFSLYACF